MNYDELNRFTDSLTYSIRCFILLCHGPKEGPRHNGLPLNTLVDNIHGGQVHMLYTYWGHMEHRTKG